MRMCLKTIVLLAVVMFESAPALAQKQPVTFLAGGTLLIPLSGTADNFSPGFGVDVGATWNLSEQAGIRLDLVYGGIKPRNVPDLPDTPPLNVVGRVQFGTVAFVFQAPPGRARIFVLAGGGLYRRTVDVSVLGSGSVGVCNPWWFACPGAGGVAGSRSTTNLGANVGFGVVIGPAFIEGRFHYSWGPTFETVAGPQRASGKFFPITVGVRF